MKRCNRNFFEVPATGGGQSQVRPKDLFDSIVCLERPSAVHLIVFVEKTNSFPNALLDCPR